MQFFTIQHVLATLQALLADALVQDQQVEQHLSSLQEQVRNVQYCFGKEPPRAGRKQYLLACLASIALDCAYLYAAWSSLEQLQGLLVYWQSEAFPRLLRAGTPWEYAIMQLLQASTRLYRLTHTSVGGTPYARRNLLCGMLANLLRAIDQCALLLGSDLEQRLQRALDGFPLIPPPMQCLGTGLLSWLTLRQDDGSQKRIVLLEGCDGHLVSLLLPQEGSYGQAYALVCEERDPSVEKGELPGVPYEQPLLLGEGRIGSELAISPAPHACWFLANDGAADPWDQEALHRVDYRYTHLLFLPISPR